MVGTYSEILGAFEPLKANNFRLFITSAGKSGTTITADALASFSLAVTKSFAPSESSEVAEIGIDNEKVYYAGRQTYEAGSVSVRDYVDAVGAGAIAEWRKKIYDPGTGKMGYKAEYAGTANLVQYDPKGSIVKQWQLVNIWPVSVNYGEMDQASTDHVSIEVSFRYDKAILTIGPAVASAV